MKVRADIAVDPTVEPLKTPPRSAVEDWISWTMATMPAVLTAFVLMNVRECVLVLVIRTITVQHIAV
jgi:hypothetical protein